jgi:hypothetical protein
MLQENVDQVRKGIEAINCLSSFVFMRETLNRVMWTADAVMAAPEPWIHRFSPQSRMADQVRDREG